MAKRARRQPPERGHIWTLEGAILARYPQETGMLQIRIRENSRSTMRVIDTIDVCFESPLYRHRDLVVLQYSHPRTIAQTRSLQACQEGDVLRRLVLALPRSCA
jgi:hypothetical protein